MEYNFVQNKQQAINFLEQLCGDNKAMLNMINEWRELPHETGVSFDFLHETGVSFDFLQFMGKLYWPSQLGQSSL